MTKRPEPISILAPESFREKLSRRSLFQIGGAAGGLALLAACGSDDEDSGSSDTAGGSSDTTADGSSATPPAGSVLAEYSNVINQAEGTIAMYTWGDYNDPEIVGPLAESTLGVSMKVDFYASNEDLIVKLEASQGTSGFDIVVPTGAYIPQMIAKGLLEKLDLSKIPNIVNVDPAYRNRDWDPDEGYSVCKNWGSTGWMWNKAVTGVDSIATWQEFIDVAMNQASGQTAVIDTAPNLAGMYFWANGIDWTTEEAADLDACEAFLVDEFAQHIKAFDSYPSTKIAEGAYTLAMAWNGDARQALVRIADAGGDPEEWAWGLGAPATEIWMDLYCIAAGAPNPDAAHAWINWLLTPEVSIQDLNYHGYNSGLNNMDALLAELVPDLVDGDMIFFSDAQVASMQTGAVNSSQERLVEILNKVKAKAAG